jgi:hypothetical protein
VYALVKWWRGGEGTPSDLCLANGCVHGHVLRSHPRSSTTPKTLQNYGFSTLYPPDHQGDRYAPGFR